MAACTAEGVSGVFEYAEVSGQSVFISRRETQILNDDFQRDGHEIGCLESALFGPRILTM